MNLIIGIFTVILAFTGIVVSVWSILDTRKKYYDEFVQNRKDRVND